jgi:hypothetical protein
LGILAQGYSMVIVGVGAVIFIAALAIYKATVNKKIIKI